MLTLMELHNVGVNELLHVVNLSMHSLQHLEVGGVILNLAPVNKLQGNLRMSIIRNTMKLISPLNITVLCGTQRVHGNGLFLLISNRNCVRYEAYLSARRFVEGEVDFGEVAAADFADDAVIFHRCPVRCLSTTWLAGACSC